MMSAAAMGATAFQKGLGAIHALSHPVGALYDTHHGLTNAVFMPYVLVFNRKADRGQDRAARRLSRPEAALQRLSRLDADAARASSACRTRSPGSRSTTRSSTLMSKMAPKDPTAGGNPVKLTRAGAQKLYGKALAGTALSERGRRPGSRASAVGRDPSRSSPSPVGWQ